MFGAQAGGERAMATRIEQGRQLTLFLGEVGDERGAFRAQLCRTGAGEKMPAEPQRGMVLARQLDEARVAFHGRSSGRAL